MKVRVFIVRLISVLLFSASPYAWATQKTESLPIDNDKQIEYSAIHYLQKMKLSYQQLNYEMLFLNTATSNIEPQQLIHGVIDGKRIAYFRYLNGAIRESLQFDGKISYYEQGIRAYSLLTTQDLSLFAGLANYNFDRGNEYYDYLMLGKGRIAGKQAIAIRMISKDEYRYSYVIWLDSKSYLPLRLDTLNQSNAPVEQTIILSLQVTKQVNPLIQQLSTQQVPDVLHFPIEKSDESMRWQVNWLPDGFKIIKDDQHKLMMHDTDPVSYFMLTDELVKISVYISAKKDTSLEQDQENIIQRGDTLLYTKQQGNIEINIIGEIPEVTAEKIAASIRMVE